MRVDDILVTNVRHIHVQIIKKRPTPRHKYNCQINVFFMQDQSLTHVHPSQKDCIPWNTVSGVQTYNPSLSYSA